MTNYPFRKINTVFALTVLLIIISSGHLFCNSTENIPENRVDISDAVIFTTENLSEQENAAVQLLIDEIFERTRIKLQVSANWPSGNVPVIVAGIAQALQNSETPFPKSVFSIPGSEKAEGFTIKIDKKADGKPVVFILGNDERGMLYGIGYFLRKAAIIPVTGNSFGKILIDRNLEVTTSPAVPLRGHQLGYRPKTNSYDGFTEEMWDKYIRELAIFGTNAIEIMPPNTDDAAESPMFFLPQMEMMVEMNKIISKYGLDTWIWYPLMYDYTKSEELKKSLQENEEIFSRLQKIDAIFIPGGDPGHTPPKLIFKYLSQKAEILHKYHPAAKFWISPQGFNKEKLEIFFSLLGEKPAWLGGVVYGPQVGMSLKELRGRVPADLPIRLYPDITHTYTAQYPVPDWDFAFAVTQTREPINPRPVDQSFIFRSEDLADYYGFSTYSEGVNDDVNKIVWSCLGWNPDADVREILRDYSRFFIGYDYANDFAQGIFDLESNWKGSLLSNEKVNVTLQKFRAMEKNASPRQMLNWRFQSALYRAYLDAYVRSRLIYETALENEARTVLENARKTSSLLTIGKAEKILDKAYENNNSINLKNRVYELAQALFQSIHMQLSSKKHFAIEVWRGANLDLIDYPLNNAPWLKYQFEKVRNLTDEKERLAEIENILNWENPGPGGFYDDMGNPDNSAHLVLEYSYEEDPGFLKHPFTGFVLDPLFEAYSDEIKDDYELMFKPLRTSWQRFSQTLFGLPLKMRYTGLDDNEEYVVRITYGSERPGAVIKLSAAGGEEIHPYQETDFPARPVQFDIPAGAVKSGILELVWTQLPETIRGNGRSCQVSEVWLMKKKFAGELKY